MLKVREGELISKGKKFSIVVSRFNEFISRRLLEACLDTLFRHGVKEEEVEVVWTPGAFEIPVVCSHLLKRKTLRAIIALGAIIRGSTPHFEYICSQVARGISTLSLRSGVPIIFGIITADTIEQAIERAGTKEGNKGKDAALSAIEMVNLLSKLK